MHKSRIYLTTMVLLLCVGSIAAVSRKTPALLLFGRQDHKTFIGCLNCASTDAHSICNRFSDYGSPFSDTSIWNQFGDSGSRFSDYSPWNRFASYPPVIVDAEGNSYGYFTANRSHEDRTTIVGLVRFLDNVDSVVADLQGARDAFCGG